VQHEPPDRAAQPPDSGVPSEHDPVTTGTLFILIVFLMALAGLWGIMYLTLLGR